MNLGQGSAKSLVAAAVILLTAGIVLGVTCYYPITTGVNQSSIIINDTFQLSPNAVRRQGIGAFQGDENLTLKLISNNIFVKNFSVVTYDGCRFNISTPLNVTYAFNAGADYYEAIFATDKSNNGTLNFQTVVYEPQIERPLSLAITMAKILFGLGLAAVILGLLKIDTKKNMKKASKELSQTFNRITRRRLMAIFAISLVVWFSVLAITPNPLGTFENWYTDHVRHPYVASLFLKEGLSIFSEPLGVLASWDSSNFIFVTWPEMPHLYPLGSVALFFPFGTLLQAGVDAVLVYKLEIAVFLAFAHICLYLFLMSFLKKDMNVFWKLAGIYIMYVTLVIYAANGMFDSVAFAFSILAVMMFLKGRYDRFILLMAISVLFKYQAGIFLLPFLILGVVELVKTNFPMRLIQNKYILVSALLATVSGFTAFISGPFLLNTRPELVLNGINAFTPHAQIPWSIQATAVLFTLVCTIIYSIYMFNKNRFLAYSALFLMLPSLTLPYFQNWYLPFLFIYILVPNREEELEATFVWLFFMIFVLSFGGIAFSPLQILNHFRTIIGI